MNHGEFGISSQEQLDIRARAVLGAIEDQWGAHTSAADERGREEARSLNDDAIASIMESLGVGKVEAMIILTEQLFLELKNREEN